MMPLPEHAPAAAQVRGEVDVPTLVAQEREVCERRLGARQDDEVGIPLPHLGEQLGAPLLAVRETIGVAVGTDRDDSGGEFGVLARFEQGAEVAPAPGDEDDEPEHSPSLPMCAGRSLRGGQAGCRRPSGAAAAEGAGVHGRVDCAACERAWAICRGSAAISCASRSSTERVSSVS